MMIDSYEFGRIVIDGKIHTSDVIIYPDHIDSGWWRKEGHKLQIEDLSAVLEWGPEALIVGIGANGMMKITKEVQTYLKSKGIKLISAVTADACRKHNEITKKAGEKVVTALHLTC
ncbi:MAG: Mth938-like domain-containing protein [Candidatus Brocadiales bacterium]